MQKCCPNWVGEKMSLLFMHLVFCSKYSQNITFIEVKKKNMYYNFLQNKKFVLVKIWNWKSIPINFLQYGFLCNYEYFSGKAWLPVSLGYKYEVTYRSNSSFCVEELHKLGNGKKKIAKLLKMPICTIRAIINWRC